MQNYDMCKYKPSLYMLLSNGLVLRHVASCMRISTLLGLATTSKPIRSLIFNTPGIFQRVDLSHLKALRIRYDVNQESLRDRIQLYDQIIEEYNCEE